jgi:hypothetical protein
MKKVIFCAVGICWILTALKLVIAAETPKTPSSVITEQTGRKVYIDPATGQRGAPPTLPALPPAVTNRVSTSSEGLKELPVNAKPGGFKVHLGGRFQSTLTATSTATGSAAVQCAQHTEQSGSTATNSIISSPKTAP